MVIIIQYVVSMWSMYGYYMVGISYGSSMFSIWLLYQYMVGIWLAYG